MARGVASAWNAVLQNTIHAATSISPILRCNAIVLPVIVERVRACAAAPPLVVMLCRWTNYHVPLAANQARIMVVRGQSDPRSLTTSTKLAGLRSDQPPDSALTSS
jgi:hypothetical protein